MYRKVRKLPYNRRNLLRYGKGVIIMISKQSVVRCESGLHNKQATYFIQKANEFRSSIWIEVDNRKINAKSLLGVLSMGVIQGTAITLIADGVDEEAAVEELTQMLQVDVF